MIPKNLKAMGLFFYNVTYTATKDDYLPIFKNLRDSFGSELNI